MAQAQASASAGAQNLPAGAIAALQRQMSLQARNQSAIQAMQNAQSAARAAALSGPNFLLDGAGKPLAAVPDGIKAGGLDPLRPQNWTGAGAPTETVNATTGTVTDTVKQTEDKAILSWNTFNIGKNTELDFDQGGNRSWVVLNRVVNSLAPSQILGRIKADGQVYIINHNGIIFGGSSQVDVKALTASSAAISDVQFFTPGSIYSLPDPNNGSLLLPSFTGAGGPVEVQAGAQIATSVPLEVTARGGFVLLMGKSVSNAGTISTPQGQTELAAGADFILQPGYSTTGIQYSTTLGNEIAAVRLLPDGTYASGNGGAVSNTGLISSLRGDITLLGGSLTQAGVLTATSSATVRGTIHLLTPASDPASSILLTPGSVTSITVDPSTDPLISSSLNSKRADAISASALQNANRVLRNPQFDDYSQLGDRQDQSRVELVSGGTVEFQGNSLTQATGGQIAVSAVRRIQADAGAILDVSGSNVLLPASANELAVNIQGFQLRDAPQNRDPARLNSLNVTVDESQLVLVPAGTQGYATDRYYTRGGLLEVGGILAKVPHSEGEFTSLGGSIAFSTDATFGSVITQPGSVFNISGGSIAYQAGPVGQSYFLGADGSIYNVNSAPANLLYASIYTGFIASHPKWGVTETYADALHPSQIFQSGYTVGRDAGTLVLSTPTSIFEGQILAAAANGSAQTQSRIASAEPLGSFTNAVYPVSDPYLLTQTTVALPGTLAVGQYLYSLDKTLTFGLAPALAPSLTSVTFASTPKPVAASITVNTDLSQSLPSRLNTSYFDANQINGSGLGGILIAVGGQSNGGNPIGDVSILSPLTLAPGGVFQAASNTFRAANTLTVRGGTVAYDNTFASGDPSSVTTILGTSSNSGFTLAPGGSIDTRGLWTNALLDPANATGEAFVNGGSITIGLGATLFTGSVIDASSGGAILSNGQTLGGQGGNISLGANKSNLRIGQNLRLGGELQSYGVTKGGALTLVSSANVFIGDTGGAAGDLVLPTAFFSRGFSAYSVLAAIKPSSPTITVAPDTILTVTEPVQAFTSASFISPTGTDPSSALRTYLPPLYLENSAKDRLIQRAGASLTLTAAPGSVPTLITIGANSVINLDPGQSFTAAGRGQLTIGDNAQIHAPGGAIGLLDSTPSTDVVTGQSIWIGSNSVLNASGLSATAIDALGRRYGIAQNGGAISIGTIPFDGTTLNVDTQNLLNTTADFIVVRPGARLEASGSSTTIDLPLPGLNQGSTTAVLNGNGGSIAISSFSGIYNDGRLLGAKGGGDASGGSLFLGLERPTCCFKPDPAQANDRVLTIGQTKSPSGLTSGLNPGILDGALIVGKARTSVAEIAAGGFDSVSLYARDALLFDDQGSGNLSLSAARSISLYEGAISTLDPSANVSVNSAYVLLSGYISPNVVTSPTITASQPKPQTGLGTFTANAGLIQTANVVAFGQKTGNASYAGFQNAVLSSTGDIVLGGGTLDAPGNVDLNAAQIYGSGLVFAGLADAAHSTITIGRTTSDIPPVPYSAFGSLGFFANVIDQGGIVRAPGGSITFSDNGRNNLPAVVNLLPGSITSIGTSDLSYPYGGTADGVTYNVNGTRVSLSSGAITFLAQSVTVDKGATVDISGGGSLLGAAFITGRGGSVDTLVNPFLSFDPGAGTYNAPSLKQNPVYAIVPGMQSAAAPAAYTAQPYSGSIPGVGDAVKISDESIPGLPAGTYTLLPANYALLPGAFRIEIGGVSTQQLKAERTLNGSYIVTGTRTVENTSISASLPNFLTVTPGNTARTYSSYNETTYDAFALKNAATLGQTRPMLLADAKTVKLTVVPGAHGLAFSNQGMIFTAAGPGGFGAISIADTNQTPLEVVNGAPTVGFTGSSLDASSLTALNADTLIVGGDYVVSNGNTIAIAANYNGVNNSSDVIVRSGVTLGAPNVILAAQPAADGTGGSITVESNAAINTLGFGPATRGFTNGYVYTAAGTTLTVSNGQIVYVGSGQASPGGLITVENGAQLYAKGSIGFYTTSAVDIGPAAGLGAPNLTLASTNIDIGATNAYSATVVPQGLTFTNGLLSQLLAGNTGIGAPKLQSLSLTALNSINLFGPVDLTTIDPSTGKSSLAELDFNTPGIYGSGANTATLQTGKFVWNGVETGYLSSNNQTSAVAPPPIAGGPGSGSGVLNVVADTIVLGYPSLTQPDKTPLDRTALGFSAVNLIASTSITGSNNGALKVYREASYQGAKVSYAGGDLNLVTPLLTGDSGSVLKVTAGGALTLTNSSSTDANRAAVAALGGELDLSATSIALNSSIVLPSGSLSVVAAGNITLGSASKIDLSGRLSTFFDGTRYSQGGIVTFESTGGNITQAAGSLIDVSAVNADGGSIGFNAAAGSVALRGGLAGDSRGGLNTSSFSIAAQNFGAATPGDYGFSALNALLDGGLFDRARSFDLKGGSLTISNTVKAHTVDVSVDAGSLLVNGKIDASGTMPGSIRLAASTNLTIASTAILDASGSQLQADFYGQPIDAQNKGTVDLAAVKGTLALKSGARIDLSSPIDLSADGNQGELRLDAPRTAAGNGIMIDAAGPLDIRGAKSIALYGDRTYAPRPGKSGVVIDQSYLNAIDKTNASFIKNTAPNAAFQTSVKGLTRYGSAFHLRPGVEIASSGDLTVSGDLDFSRFRYGAGVKASVPGSGEPGNLVLRAAGNLTVTGTINDGFDTRKLKADNTWTLFANGNALAQNAIVSGKAVVLPAGSTFAPGTVLGFNAQIPGSAANGTSPALVDGTVLPVAITLDSDHVFTSGFVASGTIFDASGKVRYAAGQYVSATPTSPVTLPSGFTLAAGFTLPSSSATPWTFSKTLTWPAGTPLTFVSSGGGVIDNYALPADVSIAPGGYVSAGTVVSSDITLRTNAKNFAAAPLLSPGTLSWSYRLAGGSDLGAADARITRPVSALNGSGNVVLSDPHQYPGDGNTPAVLAQSQASFIRTGTGSLDILAGGSYSQTSLYGVYTAGSQLAINPATGKPGFSQAGYAVDGGGDVLISAGRNLTSYVELSPDNSTDRSPVGGWLFRQAGQGLVTSWGINFAPVDTTDPITSNEVFGEGFTGFGALGGGNVTIRAGGNAGDISLPLSTGLTSISAAVGGTGYVTPSGQIKQTGGGNLVIDVRGGINLERNASGVQASITVPNYGTLTNIRGNVTVKAGSLGTIPLSYGIADPSDPRTPNPLAAGYSGTASVGGPALFLGDAVADFRTRGDLVVATAGDPGKTPEVNPSNALTGRVSAFSLFTDRTAINLTSSGGNLSLPVADSYILQTPSAVFLPTNEGGAIPSQLSAIAVSGNIYVAGSYVTGPNGGVYGPGATVLSPSATGQLELLAGGSIFGNNAPIGISGADPALRATPFRPVYNNGFDSSGSLPVDPNGFVLTNANPLGDDAVPFGLDTPTFNLHANDPKPARIDAASGDIVNLQFGQAVQTSPLPGALGYLAAKRAEIRAGRDIVAFGVPFSPFAPQGSNPTLNAIRSGVLFHDNPSDISVISAGRDILYANATVAGPGLLEVDAGRNVYQGVGQSSDQSRVLGGQLESVGLLFGLNSNNTSGGASITVLAGIGSSGPDYKDFARVYLDPANLADPNKTLASQPGKSVASYTKDLIDFAVTYGFTGLPAADPYGAYLKLAPQQQSAVAGQAYRYFIGLPLQRQGVLVRRVYFNELTAAGREYNNAISPRYRSYLRGRDAIATLFPSVDANGNAISYYGDLTEFAGFITPPQVIPTPPYVLSSYIRTDFGGDIQTFTPGGATTVGVEGIAPGAGSGFLTQGAGDIDIFSKDSVLLGQSRVFTTFGGNILVWSEDGDINAGRGATTTQVFSPPRIVYDSYGNITLAPTVPTTGAGFATLNPIPEIPPGDIDLIAPLGIVDAGEAGIRVSGNINIAALQVLNANNIQVQGKSTGLPVFEGPNTNALTNATNTSAAANQAVPPAARNDRASIIIVEIIGFGGSDDAPSGDCPNGTRKAAGKCPAPAGKPIQGAASNAGQNLDLPVTVVGAGILSASEAASIEPAHRTRLVQ